MEKKKPWLITAAIVTSVQLLLQVLTVLFVLRLNMLPNQYVIVFILTMVLLLEGVALLMFIPVKDRIRLWRKIVSCVLSAAIIAGCVFASLFANNTYRFMKNVSGNNMLDVTQKQIHVLVLNESPAQSLADTKGFRYGVMPEYDAEHTQHAISAVTQATENTVRFTNYQQVITMVNALYNNEIDALILHNVNITLLLEQEGYQDFLSRARVLYTETIEENLEVPTQPPREDIEESCFVIYISGSDTRSKILDVSRSDVNILAVVNPNTKQILLINTPRDYYIPNPAGKGKLDKLTHCGNAGVGCSMEALGTLYDTKIDYYMQINFTGFEKLVDAIGGVTVYSDQSFYTFDGSYIQKGENQLDGKKALQFARERYNVKGGDNGRGMNQMKIIKAIVEKLSSSPALITNYADILKSLEKMFVTNFHMEEISDLVKMQLRDMPAWDVKSFAVDGKGSMEWCYSWTDYELSVTIPDEATVNHARSLIDRVFDGQVITAEDTVMPKNDNH